LSETKSLSSFIVSNRFQDIPRDVIHEAKRALLNFVGCAIGGSREPAVDTAIRALQPFSGERTAGLLARPERFDPLYASVINGISGHVFEYDDTTPMNYIHPTPPVASALFAFASANRVAGIDFLQAFVMGFEAESRVGNAVYPAHYNAGWHITATAGVFGAAAAVGKLLGLSTQEMIWAMGLASTQASGLREMFGSMAKSFHAGHAARNGYLSAVLAKAGFTAGEHAIEGPRAFAAVQASEYDLSKITTGLGEDYQIRYNTYKPYPCGIVVHPTIDGCIELHHKHHPAPESIGLFEFAWRPWFSICATSERSGKVWTVSTPSTTALPSVWCVARPVSMSTRMLQLMIPLSNEFVSWWCPTGDASITEDQSNIEVELENGTILKHSVECSLGNIRKPLSDAQLEEKFKDQARLTHVDRLIEMFWKFDDLSDVNEIVRATCG
jgi:2-methylcitrate dehydratase PrpD